MKPLAVLAIVMTCATTTLLAQAWTPQVSNTRASLRGVSAVDARTVWASGSGGTWLLTNDGGPTWTVATTPIRNDGAAAGIFSLAFRDSRHGIAVGGDYSKDKEDRGNVAVTSDGGRTWTATAGGPKGFRSAVAYIGYRKLWIIATGTSGSDISNDGG